ncbi:hypothetical protein FQN57_002770 [Myotisia sp. PD_48]|nr:hypothetical protein FQN57_002770 [Myotisia sp. PD_48]
MWQLSIRDIATKLLSGNIVAILIAFAVAFSLPIILHWYLYRTGSTERSTEFLLLGPSGSGKTAFCSLLEQRRKPGVQPRTTHTSQVSSVVPVTLHPTVRAGTDRYRSVNDPSLADTSKRQIRCTLRDIPGHRKLRDLEAVHSLLGVTKSTQVKNAARGIIFMVDSTSLSDAGQLSQIAEYLYDVLVILQRRSNKLRQKSSLIANTPVLVAANKQDLFAALPATSIRAKLAAEIEAIRTTKRKGLMDARGDVAAAEDEQELLGGDENVFDFNQLEEEIGVKFDVIGGTVVGGDEKDATSGVRSWEEWIASCL